MNRRDIQRWDHATGLPRQQSSATANEEAEDEEPPQNDIEPMSTADSTAALPPAPLPQKTAPAPSLATNTSGRKRKHTAVEQSSEKEEEATPKKSTASRAKSSRTTLTGSKTFKGAARLSGSLSNDKGEEHSEGEAINEDLREELDDALMIEPKLALRPIVMRFQNQSLDTTTRIDLPDQPDTDRLLNLIDPSLLKEYRYSSLAPPLRESSMAEPKPKTNDRALNLCDAPRSNIYEIFTHLTDKARGLGLDAALPSRKLRIVTMCSGTESPLLALKLILNALQRCNQTSFKFEHLASAEIVIWKQAYIDRNFGPLVIFADVTDFLKNGPARTVYGGTAPLPENVDLLIAGSSCVDFSCLNQNRRNELDGQLNLENAGESYRTLAGIRAYADKARPRIIILENVNTAPWQDMITFLEQIQYRCTQTAVDTKDYYLPQTRQRGYLVAFDTKYLSTIKFDIEVALASWTGFMKRLESRATAPFTDFIFPDNDPYLEELKRSHLQAPPASHKQDWAKSRHRHAKIRVEQKLGFLRPMTQWQDNGSCKFPNHGHIAWAKIQRERIWDTLDIEYLRYISERDYDLNYKARWIDVSQNVDRDNDSRPWGLVSCVTPDGMMYLSSRGGLVTGMELLALQGIPIRDINLTRETPKQLQDLAGNAMSSTVVGAAILSAILAANAGMKEETNFFRCFDNVDEGDSEHTSSMGKATDITVLLQEKHARDLVCKQIHVGPRASYSIDRILHEASQTFQICGCEGSSLSKKVLFSICQDCGHTSCFACSENPPHNYIELRSDSTSRSTPAIFKRTVLGALPAFFYLSTDNFTVPSNVFGLLKGSKLTGSLEAFFQRAFNSEVYYKGVSRSRSWKVTFEGEKCRLDLIFTRSNAPDARSVAELCSTYRVNCFWLLYAKPDRELPLRDPLRKALEQPIARMRVLNSARNLWDGNWEQPYPDKLDIQIKASGRVIPSFEQQIGLQHNIFKNLNATSELIVSTRCSTGESFALQGTYKKLPKCGGASGSLHARIDNPRDHPGPQFLFLEPKPLQHARSDYYVFSNTNHKVSIGDYRETRLQMPPNWRPLFQKPGESETKQADFQNWLPSSHLRIHEGKSSSDLCMWVPESLDTFNWNNFLPCYSSQSTLFIMQLPLDSHAALNWTTNQQYPIDLVGNTSALDQYCWLMNLVADHLPQLGIDLDIPVERMLATSCTKCAPPQPNIEYADVEVYAKGSKSGAPKIEVRPIENAEEASDYEAALKKRPPPLEAFIHCHETFALLEVKLNVLTLCHRVLAKLDVSRGRSSKDLKITWRLERANLSQESVQFRPPTLLSNVLDPPLHGLPAGFCRNLWPNQQKAVQWMIGQDQQASKWSEYERGEIETPALDLRVVIEAQLKIDVRGGILADEVGSGKTTTSLALVAHNLAADRAASQSLSNESMDGLVHLHSTLIMVPYNILNQWEDDIQKCWKEDQQPILLKIQTAAELDATTVDQFKQADIILIAWDTLDRLEYWLALQAECNARHVPLDDGRVLEDWLCDALHNRDNPSSYDEPSTSGVPRSSTPSTLAGGFDIASNTSRKNFDVYAACSKRPAVQENLSCKGGPTLHKFHFRRLIVDEYTYLQSKSYLATCTLRADSKFMLSGTPSLGTFAQVDNLARLVGTRIRCDDEKEGRFSLAMSLKTETTKSEENRLREYKKSVKNISNVEEFQSYQVMRSPAWYKRRYLAAEEFVRTFVRQNPSTPRGVELVCHCDVTELYPSELIIYFEVHQQLMSQGNAFGIKFTKGQLDAMNRDGLILATITSCNSPEEALLTCFAAMSMFGGDAIGACEDTTDAKAHLLATEGKNILLDLQEAIFYERCGEADKDDNAEEMPHLDAFKLRVIRNQIGDPTVATVLDRLLQRASLDPRQPLVPFSHRIREPLFLNEPLDTLTSSQIAEILDYYELPKSGSSEEKTKRIQEARKSKEVKLTKQKESERAKFADSMKKDTDGKDKATKAQIKMRARTRTAESKARGEGLNLQCLEIVNHVRRLRFFEALNLVLSGTVSSTFCNCCGKTSTLDTMTLMGVCGHLICDECLGSSGKDDYKPDGCAVNGCDGPGLPHHLLQASSLSRCRDVKTTENGSKMQAVIQAIRRIPKNEKIIIFVQYEKIKNSLIAALKRTLIFDRTVDATCADGKGTPVRSKVERFKRDANMQVLILQIDSPDAAGWNLQEANHIMFPVVYVAPNQYQYKATTQQAIGRAFRCNQRKNVHVYHFLMSKTIEVNILQERENVVVVEEAGGFSLKEPNGSKGAFEGPSIKGGAWAAGDLSLEEE